MASRKEYLEFVLGQIDLDGITYRQMMGEYLLYRNGIILGGIYDDMLLVKPTKSAKEYMPDAELRPPYDGAKAMLFVDEVDDKEFLTGLFAAIYDELSAQKPSRKNNAPRQA